MNPKFRSIDGLQRFVVCCFIALSFALAPTGSFAQTAGLMDDALLIADDFSTSVNQASLTAYNRNAQTGMLAGLPYTVEGTSSQPPVTTLYDSDTNNVLILTRKVSGDAAGPIGFGYTYDFNQHAGYTVQVEMKRQSASWVSLAVGGSAYADPDGAEIFTVRFLDDGTVAVYRNGPSGTALVFPASTINEYDQFTAVRIQFENTAWDGTGTLTAKLFVNKTPSDESSWTQLDLGGSGGSYVRPGGFTANCVSFVSRHEADASVSYYRNPRIGFNRPDLYSISDADLNSFFLNPPNRYRLIQSGGHATENIQKFPEYGIGNSLAFFYYLLYKVLPNGPAAINSRVDLNNTNGFTPWLADDFYFPSGQAGGMVVEENPDWETRGVTCLTATGTGTDPVTLDLPTGHNEEKFISAVIYPLVDGVADIANGTVCAVETNQVVVAGIPGPWELCGFVQVLLTNAAGQTADSFGTTGKYPDLMNADAMESFIGYMHEGITDRITDFASKVEGFYTNEPQLAHLRHPDHSYARIPWTQDLFAAFEQQHGYSLEPKLLALYAGTDVESRRVRMHFRQTIAELMSGSYARQIREWCESRGIASTGHPLLEESLLAQVAIYGDLMKFESEFSYPAQDIGIPNPGNYATFDYRRTRFMSSVAAWKQRDRSVLFLDPIVDGGGTGRLSPSVPLMKNAANNGFLNGANAFHTIVVLDASDDGTAAGYTTNEYQSLNEYIGRIAVLLRGARRETSVALYYPIAEMQAAYVPSTNDWTDDEELLQSLQDSWTATGDALLNADIDYTIVHPDAVGQAEVADGVMNIGYGSYRYLVMPQINGFLPKPVLDKITEFENGGGTVLWVDSRPLRATYAADDAAVSNALKNVATVTRAALPGQIGSDVYDDAFKLSFTPTVKTQLEIARFTRENRRIYFLVNRTGDSLSVTANASAPVTVEICNPVDGTISDPTNMTASTQFVLGGCESLLLMECDDEFEEPVLPAASYAYNPTNSPWTFVGNTGILRNGSIWTSVDAPEGRQAAFIQGAGSIYKSIDLDAGTYELHFYAARRNGQIQPIQVSVGGDPAGETITPANNNFNEYVTDSFTVPVSGSYELKFEGTVSGPYSSFIDDTSLQRQNTPSVATNLSISVDEDTSGGVTLTGSDIDGDPLVFAVLTQPAHGSLSGTAPNLTYTPATNYNGSDSFTFSVNDSDPATVSITVNAVNDAPTISDIADQTVEKNTATAALAFTLSDAETPAGSLTLTKSSSNTALVPEANIVLGGSDSNRTVTITPAANRSGAATITLTVSDGQLSAGDSFVVTVPAVLTANLGYDSAGETNQLAIIKDAGLDSAVFTDVTLGTGVTVNAQAGVATGFDNAYTPGYDGSRGYQHWDLDGSGSWANAALNSGHYLQFALTLDSAEVESLNSVTVNGVAVLGSVNNFALMLSTNNFVTASEVTRKNLPTPPGGSADDAANPWTGYGDVVYTLETPVLLDEGTTTFSFKLAIAEDGLGNARAIALNSIRFGVTLAAFTGPAPVSQIRIIDGSSIVISWDGDNAATYTIQCKEDLCDGAWSNVADGVVGTGTLCVTNNTDVPQAFYRVVIE